VEGLDILENEAVTLGYERVLNRRTGERVGIGKSMPSSTDIIEAMFGDQAQYRILSRDGPFTPVRDDEASPQDDEPRSRGNHQQN
jgi:hypothetical protein